MGDEDETYATDIQVYIFPNENEWPWLLTENDVPGASLDGVDPSRATLAQLKFWLKCRGISSTYMTKAQAVDVVTKTLTNTDLMSQPILDPKYPHYTDKKIQRLRQNGDLTESLLQMFPSLKPPTFPSPSEKWEPIGNVSTTTTKYLKLFNEKTIFEYYSVMAEQRDTGFHTRALTRGRQHNAANHVQNVIVCLQDPAKNELVEKGLYVKATVSASMKNARYDTRISLYQFEPMSTKVKIRYAECKCVAGYVSSSRSFKIKASLTFWYSQDHL